MRLFYLILFAGSLFAEKYYPNEVWETREAEEVNLNQEAVNKLFQMTFEDQATMSAVLIKDGYIVEEQYANGFDKNSFGTSWSTAKSFYAALIGISLDKGEIKSLDDHVAHYVESFNDQSKKDITIRQILNMTSGLEFPSHEHEMMFFEEDHLKYALDVGVESTAGEKFQYNNVNSMLMGEILKSATGKTAKELIDERIFTKIGIQNYTAWEDSAGNTLTYCCLDMSARDYSKLGLLFARDGKWNDEQIVSKEFVDETFQVVWETPSRFTDYKRYYSLHWWVSKYDEESKIFNTSGKFGQYTFVDRENDIVVTRISKYEEQDNGSTQKWGIMKYLRWAGIDNAIAIGRMLIASGTIESGSDVITPFTDEEGESYEFYVKYPEIIDSIADLSRN